MKQKSERKRRLLARLGKEDDIEKIVNEWIGLYKENQRLGIMQVVQLMLDAGGNNKKLNVEIMDGEDPHDLIESIKGMMPNVDIPPIMKQKLKVNISVFFTLLVQKCNNLLYDSYLLDTMFAYIVPMACNRLRVLRLVGTLAIVKLMTGLVNVLKLVKEHLSIAQQQLSAEEQKTESKSSDRIELLQNKIFELLANEKELTALLNDFLLKLVFQQRIFDKYSQVQILCVSEAVIWMQICPEMFMVDCFLVYYKNLMPFPDPALRHEILKSLLLLYDQEIYKNNLKTFTVRCVSRLVTLTLDVSKPVAVLALKLLSRIVSMYGTGIVDDMKESLFRLIFSRHRTIASAAGAFLAIWLKESSNDSLSGITILTNLVLFFEEAHLPNHAPYMVDSLFDKYSELTDWEMLCHILIQETADMTEKQEKCFLKILSATMEQACTGISPRAKNEKPSKSCKASKMREAHKLQITEYFSSHIPRILHKYRVDSENVTLILQMMKHIQFKQLLPANELILSSLFKSMENIIQIHSDKKIIQMCCNVADNIYSHLPSSSDLRNFVWSSIENTYYKKFMQAVDIIETCFRTNISPTDDQIFTLNNTLEKLAIFYEYKNQRWYDLWNICLNYITHSFSKLVFPVSFIKNCIQICYLMILWERSKAEKEYEESMTEEDVNTLQRKLLEFSYVLEKLLSCNICDLCKTAFFIMCDMLLMFSDRSSPLLPILPLTTTPDLEALLQKYVENIVFLGNYSEKVKNGINLELRQLVLLSYCKLVSYRILDTEKSSWVFKYYDMKKNDYTDILKKTFNDLLKHDSKETASALLNYIADLFKNLHDIVEREDILSIKTTLKKTIEAFTLLLTPSPSALLHFHKEGIFFAYQEEDCNIFMEVMMDHIQTLNDQQISSLIHFTNQMEGISKVRSESARKYLASLSKILKTSNSRKISDRTGKLDCIVRKQTSINQII